MFPSSSRLLLSCLPLATDLFLSPSLLSSLLFLSSQFLKVPENSWWQLSCWAGDNGEAEQLCRRRRSGRSLWGARKVPCPALSSLESTGAVSQTQAISRTLWGFCGKVSQKFVPCLAPWSQLASPTLFTSFRSSIHPLSCLVRGEGLTSLPSRMWKWEDPFQ